MDPFVFIVGCARSGTTLLQRIVDAHPQLAITPEMHWITDYFRQGKWLGPDGRVMPDQVSSMIQHKRFAQFGFSQEQFEGLLGLNEPPGYVTFLERLFALYGTTQGKPLVGNKTPAYVRRISTLHGFWPEAKFIHLIRDGRDVGLSVLNWNHAYRTAGRYMTWAEDPVSTVALWWKRKVRLGRQGGQSLNPRLYHEIHYENLAHQPAAQCEKLCNFLGVAYDEAMLRFHEGRTRHEPGLDAKQAWRPITPGLRDWKTQMPGDDVERFEAVAGDMLVELGYSLAYPTPAPETKKRAARIQDLFTQDLHARGEILPDCW